MKNVLVTGGTGHLGKRVVDDLLKENYSVCVLSSRESTYPRKDIKFVKGDLSSNTGLTEATSQADIVIHRASHPGNFERVDLDGTRHLLQAINRTRTRHFVYISIVGVDKSAYPYYRAKYAVEEMITNSGIPFTILRTTQFHSFVLSILQPFVSDQLNGIIKIPAGMKFQSVDVREVARLLVNSLGQAAGLMPDFGGPEVLSFENMVQRYLDVTNASLKIQTASVAGERFDLFRSGVNLCPANAFGNLTWQSFLEEQVLVGTAPNNSR